MIQCMQEGRERERMKERKTQRELIENKPGENDLQRAVTTLT